MTCHIVREAGLRRSACGRRRTHTEDKSLRDERAYRSMRTESRLVDAVVDKALNGAFEGRAGDRPTLFRLTRGVRHGTHECRQQAGLRMNHPAARTKPNAPRAVSHGGRPQCHFVAVFQEATCFAVGQ